MLSSPSTSAPTAKAPPRSTPPESSDSRAFSLDMGEEAPAEPAPTGAPKRQARARTGKDLPDGAADPQDKSKDKAEAPQADPAFAWFATTALTPPTPQKFGFAFVRQQGAAPLGFGATAGEAAQPAAPAQPLAGASAAPVPADGDATAPAPAIAATAKAGDSVAEAPAAKAAAAPDAPVEIKPAAQAGKAEPAARPVPALHLSPVPPAPARAETVQQTIAAFAPELRPAALRRETRKEIEAVALTATASATDLARTQQVAATADAQQSALDMRRHEWMTNMVERIEALRESTGSNETRIRLSPDALGTVDISISRQGDRVDVRFHAETPAARAMLADAQPRLAELAEARGLKLGQTSVDAGATGQNNANAGTAGNGQRHDGAPQQPQTRSAPPSAQAGTRTTDERIA